jgi:hypothetical protein
MLVESGGRGNHRAKGIIGFHPQAAERGKDGTLLPKRKKKAGLKIPDRLSKVTASYFRPPSDRERRNSSIPTTLP